MTVVQAMMCQKTRISTPPAYLWNASPTHRTICWISLDVLSICKLKKKKNWEGRKYKKELLIFPRYHQWNVVTKLINAALEEGTGQKYLIQHSAGSGKSNSIAWTAHQLSTLYDQHNQKLFDSVIVVTDRTILDAQLQDTIYQFEHADGVVGRINNKEGDGSKSEKLAKALETSQPIIIVTIQTFPFVLRAIENSTNLKQRRYAVIADEAHSSQSGFTARQLKEVVDAGRREEDAELSSEDILDAAGGCTHQGRIQPQLSMRSTATPKDKTLQLFGRVPKSFIYHHPRKTSLKPIMSTPCAKPLKKALFWMSWKTTPTIKWCPKLKRENWQTNDNAGGCQKS